MTADSVSGMPSCLARRYVVEKRVLRLDRYVFVLRPWSLDVVEGLRTASTPSAFFALLCRSRVAHLHGDFRFAREVDVALWNILARVCGMSVHFLLGYRALEAAIRYFCGWVPWEYRCDTWRDDWPDALPQAYWRCLAQEEESRRRAIRSGKLSESVWRMRTIRASRVCHGPPMRGRSAPW